MQSASEQFHTAVRANSPVERVLMRFADGTILTNEDIQAQNGLKIIEAVNLDEELTIGGCPSSSLTASVLNTHGLLTGYAFGECAVWLGIKTAAYTETIPNATVRVFVDYNTAGEVEITGHATAPYLKISGSAASLQPSFAVKSIVVDGDSLYCISAAGAVYGIDISNMASLTEITGITLNSFMTAKLIRWAALARGLVMDAGICYEFFASGGVHQYEYVELGVFDIDTPAKRNNNVINITAYDKMNRFNVDATEFFGDMTYPTTLGDIFEALCTEIGVSYVTSTFINSTAVYAAAPADAEGITAKEILSWIAETAGAMARMSRDGKVELAWFTTQTFSIPETQIFKADISEYQVPAIDKMQILNSETDIGVIIGVGTNNYQILENPFLFGLTDEAIRALGQPIYDQVSAFVSFTPVVLNAVCDWSVQAGDIIEFVFNGVTYSLPIYTQTITWKGSARVVYESTGGEGRPVQTLVNRRVFNQNRAVHEIVVDVAGLTSRVSDAEGSISTLEQFAGEITLDVTNGETSSTIKLKAGETEISSESISMSGLVEFTNLYDGTTTISGSNITTGMLSDASGNFILDMDTGTVLAKLLTVEIPDEDHEAGGVAVTIDRRGVNAPKATITALEANTLTVAGRQMVQETARTYYWDPTKTGDGSSAANAHPDLQALINSLPDILRGTITVHLASGAIWPGDLVIANHHGGQIDIEGNGANITGMITINSVDRIEISSLTTARLYTIDSFCSWYGGKITQNSANHSVQAANSRLLLRNAEINNANTADYYGLYARDASTVLVQICKGDSTYFALTDGASQIYINGSRPYGALTTHSGAHIPGLIHGTGTATHGSGYVPPPEPPVQTVTMTCTGSRSRNARTGWRSDRDVLQGEYVNGTAPYFYGKHTGCMWFGTLSIPSGYSVTAVRLYLKRINAGGHPGAQKVRLWNLTAPTSDTQGALTRGTSIPNLAGDSDGTGNYIGDLARDEEKRFALPVSVATALSAGYGLCLYTDKTSTLDLPEYIQCYGSDSSYPPKIEVTCTKDA